VSDDRGDAAGYFVNHCQCTRVYRLSKRGDRSYEYAEKLIVDKRTSPRPVLREKGKPLEEARPFLMTLVVVAVAINEGRDPDDRRE
jgi:hypothetical protein